MIFYQQSNGTIFYDKLMMILYNKVCLGQFLDFIMLYNTTCIRSEL